MDASKNKEKNMKLPNRVYDVLKWVALICLPAIAVFYATLGAAWEFPFVMEITITINAIALFVGTLIGVSTIQYNIIQEKN